MKKFESFFATHVLVWMQTDVCDILPCVVIVCRLCVVGWPVAIECPRSMWTDVFLSHLVGQYRVPVADCWPLCSLLCRSVDVLVLLSAFCRASFDLHGWSLPPPLMGCFFCVVVDCPLLCGSSSHLRTCKVCGQDKCLYQFKLWLVLKS